MTGVLLTGNGTTWFGLEAVLKSAISGVIFDAISDNEGCGIFSSFLKIGSSLTSGSIIFFVFALKIIPLILVNYVLSGH